MIKHLNRHTPIPIAAIENPAVSLEAKGLYCLLATGPYLIDSEELRCEVQSKSPNPITKAKLRSLLDELQNAGLLEVTE